MKLKYCGYGYLQLNTYFDWIMIVNMSESPMKILHGDVMIEKYTYCFYCKLQCGSTPSEKYWTSTSLELNKCNLSPPPPQPGNKKMKLLVQLLWSSQAL